MFKKVFCFFVFFFVVEIQFQAAVSAGKKKLHTRGRAQKCIADEDDNTEAEQRSAFSWRFLLTCVYLFVCLLVFFVDFFNACLHRFVFFVMIASPARLTISGAIVTTLILFLVSSIASLRRRRWRLYPLRIIGQQIYHCNLSLLRSRIFILILFFFSDFYGGLLFLCKICTEYLQIYALGP